ncbi:peptidoglycan DD-metalloendopeptidase family protein [Aliagarivorans marinus]|uniref:peptidoglycan DD-metalloendopeptidase family protein n=1 Tax=Aliagarivorans marinus TaxID=561965 RepID=UPI001B7FB497|nr:peptidoglycan DD-metalloendopeptidase family protein [Aliagarivorans marinus]
MSSALRAVELLMRRWFIVLGGCLLVVACSGGDRAPAPVTQAGAYTAESRGSINSRDYTVQRGETLYSIAWRAGVDFKQLASWNGIKPPYTIFEGQKIKLRQTETKVTTPPVVATKPRPTKAPVATQSQNPRNNQVTTVNNTSKKLESTSTTEYAETSVTADLPTKRVSGITWNWPTKGRVVRGFSASANGNKGLDITGSHGQKVVAAASGRVVYAGSALRGYGKLIIVKHNDDFLSAYAHNSRLRVSEKQQVEAGQHIADMGDTGTTDTRLHFEIRLKGQSVDPRRYLP